MNDNYSLDLTDAIMDPLPPRIQQELNTSGDNIQSLRGEIREAEREAQKKRLVDTVFKEVNHAYGLRPVSIDALRRSLGLTGYTRKGLGSSAVKALQQADKTLPSNLDDIELEVLPGIADSTRQ